MAVSTYPLSIDASAASEIVASNPPSGQLASGKHADS
jgi:hypothetical protein